MQTVCLRPDLPPEVLEPVRRQLGVAYGVLNVAVPKVVLQRPRVVTSIGEGKAAGVAQHVGMCLEGKSGLNTGPLHHLREAGRREWRAALADEEEGRCRALPLQLTERAQLVAAKRVRGGLTVLRPAHIERAGSKVDIRPPKVDQCEAKVRIQNA
jgi:hypothetical protein